MKVTINEDKGIMTIEVPLQKPKDSKSGKTKVIATAQGETDEVYKDKPVFLSLNAYIKK